MIEYPSSTPVYFDAVLQPNKSLSRPAFYIVMAIVIGINLFSALAFLTVGALPIVGFLGLDALAVWIAFKLCFRTQKQWTRVRVTADHLRVDHMNPKGEHSNVELPTHFVRVDLKEPVTPHSWLTLSVRGEAYVIGRFLTVDERKSLAKAIRDALHTARRERFPSEV